MCVSDANSHSLMGSLMQLLELLYAFHFTDSKCLPSVYNPFYPPLSLLSYSRPISLLSLYFSFVLSVTLSVVSPITEWLSSLVHRVQGGVCGECLVSPIIVPVTAVSSALAVLHIQVGKFISTDLDLFVIGCCYPHCRAIRTRAQEVNDPEF